MEAGWTGALLSVGDVAVNDQGGRVSGVMGNARCEAARLSQPKIRLRGVGCIPAMTCSPLAQIGCVELQIGRCPCLLIVRSSGGVGCTWFRSGASYVA